MKKLLVILCCACIFVPEAARIIAGSVCSYSVPDEEANPICACMFTNIAIEMPLATMPDRHKELMQQTDWQYIQAESNSFNCLNLHFAIQQKLLQQDHYKSVFCKKIFHPPLFSYIF